MDGLMFDTERLYLDATIRAAEKLDYHEIGEFARGMTGLREAECIQRYREHFGTDFPYQKLSELRQTIIDRYIEKNGVPVKPGLFELLEFLKLEGYSTAVATSTSRRHALAYLEQTGAARYYDAMIFGDMLKTCKPHPGIYLAAASELKIRPSDCMALEDSFCGIQSAHAAGMKAVMVPDLLSPDENLRKQCFSCISSLFDVRSLLENLREESGNENIS